MAGVMQYPLMHGSYLERQGLDIIGLDVGFSATRRTTGVARLVNGQLSLGLASSLWESRAEILGCRGETEVAAIDAPILSELHWEARSCERLFTFGAFQRRCKPGLSHVRGTGRQLRKAGFDTGNQIASICSDSNGKIQFPRVWAGTNIVEAFPNAFLGVVVPVTRYEMMPHLRRGKKFDWLYDQWLEIDAFGEFTNELDPSGALLRECQNCANHEERAALVCVLTAGGVVLGKYTAIGDKNGGYFLLPQLKKWAPWARRELEKQRGRLENLEIWVNGELIRDTQPLPGSA